MYGHSPERGHRCPKCNQEMICTIEDGYCAVGGAESNLCDTCLRDMYHAAAMKGEDWILE
jgi:hypothetical protein